MDKTQIKEQIFKDLPQTARFIEYVNQLYGDKLVAVVATGSRTTGEHTEKSDLDLDILVKDGSEKDSGKLKDLESRLGDFPKIIPWVKSEIEYRDPENRMTTKTPFDKFELDGYSGLCKHVFWADVKANGVALVGNDTILAEMPACEKIPKHESYELGLIATRDYVKGQHAKAALRALYAAEIFRQGKPLNSDSEIVASVLTCDDYFDLPQKLAEQVHAAKRKGTSLTDEQHKKIYALFRALLDTSDDALSEISTSSQNWQNVQFYTMRTLPKLYDILAEKEGNLFAPLFITPLDLFEAELRNVGIEFHLSEDARRKIERLTSAAAKTWLEWATNPEIVKLEYQFVIPNSRNWKTILGAKKLEHLVKAGKITKEEYKAETIKFYSESARPWNDMDNKALLGKYAEESYDLIREMAASPGSDAKERFMALFHRTASAQRKLHNINGSTKDLMHAGQYEQALGQIEESRAFLREFNFNETSVALDGLEASCLTKLGRLQDAEQIIDRYLTGVYQFAYPQIFFKANKAEILAATGYCRQAISLLKEVIAFYETVGPKQYVSTWYNAMGTCFAKLGQNEAAMDCLRAAVATDPKNENAVQNLREVAKRFG
jgi:tetratricopeptide (TPR) repeat protein